MLGSGRVALVASLSSRFFQISADLEFTQEQMGPLLVFVAYQAGHVPATASLRNAQPQVLAFCDYQRRKKNLNTLDFVKLRILRLGLNPRPISSHCDCWLRGCC